MSSVDSVGVCLYAVHIKLAGVVWCQEDGYEVEPVEDELSCIEYSVLTAEMESFLVFLFFLFPLLFTAGGRGISSLSG